MKKGVLIILALSVSFISAQNLKKIIQVKIKYGCQLGTRSKLSGHPKLH